MSGHALVAIAALLLAGCRGAADERTSPEPPPAPERPAAGLPLDAVPVSDWLEAQRYRETWELFPGTLPFHPATEPHGAFVTTYASPAAMEALGRAASSMPLGAAFAIEDYFADSTLAAIGVMVRVRDPDPESKGWYFTRFAPEGEVETGPLDGCRGCHVAEPDLVFGWELGTPLPVDSAGATAAAPIDSAGGTAVTVP